MSAFMNDCCEVDAAYKEMSRDLYQEYRSYCDRVGEFTRSNAEFSNTLENLGFGKHRTNKGMVFSGIRVKPAFDEG